MIAFNKPYFTGKEIDYISEAIDREKICGNGHFTQRCQEFIEKRYGIKKALLTSSCTDALEMAALLIGASQGDEIIMPSYTFVSTANAFVLRGAKIVFADSSPLNPNIDVEKLESLITPRTKAIVVVHYAGISCDLDRVLALAKKNNLYVIEDAAQAIESQYKSRALGSVGHLACFSFHETKNIISGEGGALLINDPAFLARAEIIWEKGTNRSAFSRGEVHQYGWMDVGSSFLPSEITAAFLYAQLEEIDNIQKKRNEIWRLYYEELKALKNIGVGVPETPEFCKHNAHIFYLVCRTPEERSELISYLNSNGIKAIFHYLSLHRSSFYASQYSGDALLQSDRYETQLLRLPLHYELTAQKVQYITDKVNLFFNKRS